VITAASGAPAATEPEPVAPEPVAAEPVAAEAEPAPEAVAAEPAEPRRVEAEPALETRPGAAIAEAAETGPAPAAPEAPAREPEAPGDDRAEERAFVSPVVARIAAEHGVDVSRVPGTGRGGRVTKRDILGFIESAAPAGAPAPAEAPPHLEPPPRPTAPPSPAPPPPGQVPLAPTGGGELLEPMSVMRKAIAEHMIRSVQTSAHVTTVFEVDMSKVVAIRTRLKREYDERHDVKLTYLPFICRALVDALIRWPRLNAEIRGDQIVTKSFVNLGIAVALDDGKGLIVPVVRGAEEKNLLGIARAIADLAERARTKKLLPDEVQGGTFTITNPGGFGAIAGTPIINQPQVGILDVEAIVKRPVVVTDEQGNDAIAIRPMMNLCLTYDHRLVDGAYAAPFMRDLRDNLETWEEDAY
jgi:pyruvate dehydrogenase E2 component (dihydrolipoamide acetyltransferase)